MRKIFLVQMVSFFLFTEITYSQTSGILAYSNPPEAEKSGKIVGKIIDAENNVPMEYANVSVYRKENSKLVTGAITNANGSFEIGGLPSGNYYVEAAFIGFEKTTIKDLNLLPNSQNIDLGTISLNVSTKRLSDVNVVAERGRVEYKIDKKVINVANDINAIGGTAVTALENTPSVEVDIDGNVSLRGSSNFTVLIDGRPSVLTGSDALKQIPSSAIQSIEVITNPSVKYDPDGSAGIINVVMKNNVLSGLNGIVNIKAGTGDKYGADMMLNYKKKKYNLFLGGNWNDENNYGNMNSERESYQNDTTTFLTTSGRQDRLRGGSQLKAGFDYFLSDNTSVTVSSQIGDFSFDGNNSGNIHKYQQPGTMDIYSVQNNISNRGGNYVNAQASFLSKFNKEGTHKLEGTFDYRNRTNNSDENDDEFLSDAQYNSTGEYLTRVITSETSTSNDYRFKLDYTLPFKNGSRFESGLQSRIEDENESFDFKDFDTQTQTFNNNPLFTSDMEFREAIHSVYSTFSGKLSGIEYQLGLRGEYNNRSISHLATENKKYTLDQFDVFPSLHFSYPIGENNQLMASYSKRVNRPDGRDLDPFPSYMNQYTIRIGNPELKPEYTDSYEFSYMRKFGGSFVSLETFYRTTNNLMQNITTFDNGISYMTIANLNRDYSLGGEIMGNINATKWLLINSSFSLYNYKIRGEVLGKSIDRESTNYSGRLNTTVKFTNDSRLQLSGFYRGPSVSAQGDQKGMMSANLSYRQEFMKKKLSATLSIRDILGTAKWEGTAYGSNFKSSFKNSREPRVVMLTLSYKINNYKLDRQQSEQNEQNAPTMDEGFN